MERERERDIDIERERERERERGFMAVNVDLICFSSLTTRIILLKSFELIALSKECLKRALFLYLINCLGLLELNLLLCPEASIIK